MTKYYIYPDGTISEEPLNFMSDDYYVLEAQDEEEAYEMALMHSIPVRNLYKEEDRKFIEEFVERNK